MAGTSPIACDHRPSISTMAMALAYIMASTSPLCFITLFRVEDIHSLCIWVGVLLFWFWHSSDVIRHAICDILFVFVVIIQSCTCTLTLNYNHLQYFYLLWGWQCRSHQLQLREILSKKSSSDLKGDDGRSCRIGRITPPHYAANNQRHSMIKWGGRRRSNGPRRRSSGAINRWKRNEWGCWAPGRNSIELSTIAVNDSLTICMIPSL